MRIFWIDGKNPVTYQKQNLFEAYKFLYYQYEEKEIVLIGSRYVMNHEHLASIATEKKIIDSENRPLIGGDFIKGRIINWESSFFHTEIPTEEMKITINKILKGE